MSEHPAEIHLQASDLDRNGGTHCPNPKADMALWNTHPKVFIDLSKTGQGQCPYCGRRYTVDTSALTPHH
jgi:uncharacterized Zn-finger protein